MKILGNIAHLVAAFTIFTLEIFTAAAQDSKQYDFSQISVNGIHLHKYYTKEQLIDALGVPDEEDDVVYSYFVYNSTMVMAPPSGDYSLSDAKAVRNVVDEFGFGSIYGQDSIKFCVFTLTSDKFAVNDYVRVGDHVSKVRDMGGTVKDTKNADGSGTLYWTPAVLAFIEDGDLAYCPAFYYNKNGIITMIEVYYD